MTSKPLSTISYNSEAFLLAKLQSWYDSHLIQAYQYIFHKGEDGDSDHIHLRIEPNRSLDPMALSEDLREVNGDRVDGVRPWRESKEAPWFLYVVHDAEYLALVYEGGEAYEKIPYDYHEIKVSDYYDLDIAFIRAKATLKHNPVNLASRIKSGVDPLDLVMQGENVHTVNALTHALMRNDYSRLQRTCLEQQHIIDCLKNMLLDNDLYFYVDENGHYVLQKY